MSARDTGQPEDDRRSFASRTPVNENPDRVEYRRGFVTKHQVSGWRFLMRRIASGVALHDTRMLVDPLRTQARSVLMGLLVLATVAGGCFVFTLIWPNSAAGNDPVLADRTTSALYVRVGDQLHPVLNLTSARLIAGRPVNPTSVRSGALDKFARGNLLGIPGAPERMVPAADRDAQWTVCDAATGATVGASVLTGAIDTDGTHARPFGPHAAVLAASGDASWLLWDGKRSRIDLSDRPVTDALGISSANTEVPAPRPIAAGLFNTVPEAPALTAPVIPAAGEKPGFELPVAAPVGAVVAAHALDNGGDTHYYAVLTDGLQPISGVLAGILRNTDAYGLEKPPTLGADVVAKLPVSRQIDTPRYPDAPVELVDAVAAPVTCAHWSKPAGATTSTLSLLSGATLPLPEGRQPVELVGGGLAGTAARVAVTPGFGYLVRAVNQAPTAVGAGTLFWVSDTGVRYSLVSEPATDGAATSAATALGLDGTPLDMPWSVLSQFAQGPALSRSDALLARDVLSAGHQPVHRVSTDPLSAAPNVGETR